MFSLAELTAAAEPNAKRGRADDDALITKPPPDGATKPPPAGAKPQGKKRFEFVLVDKPSFKMRYSRRGLRVETGGGNYTAQIQLRAQVRYSYPFDSDPRTEGDFGLVRTGSLDLRRARVMVSGNSFGKWFQYTFGYDPVNNEVLNLYATAKVREWLQLRGGQWKADFDRERTTSSSRQQFVDRSIVSREFAVDRQVGMGVLGHLLPGTRGDSWYHLQILTGTGQSNGFDGDGQPMFVGRYQWNFLGQDMGLSSSDVEYHESPASSVAIGGVTNRSRYTRFASGGAQLDGYEPGEVGQYSLRQVMGEFFFKYRGLSIQNENHWKHVHDNVAAKSSSLRGSYVQAGYFPHDLCRIIPRKMEVGYRYAFVDPDVAAPADLHQEHTVVLNYFIEGHNNKLSFDVGRASLARLGQSDLSAVRYRLQWDVHF